MQINLNINPIRLINYNLDNLELISNSVSLRKYNLDLNSIFKKLKDYKNLFFDLEEIKKQKNIQSENFSKEAFSEKKTILENDYIPLLNILNVLPNFLNSDVSEKNVILFEKKFDHSFKKKSLVKDYLTQITNPYRKIIYKSLPMVENLINILKNNARSSGFNELSVPLFVSNNQAWQSGHLPKFSSEMYSFQNEELFLIPTSELSILSEIIRQEIIMTDSCTKFFAFTDCFRKEGGTYGERDKYIRLNHFSKLELFVVCEESDEEKELQNMVNTGISLLEKFQVDYRIILNSAEDTSHTSKKTLDIEAWSPSKDKYIELSSCSIVGKYQTLRSGIKSLKQKSTLNGTALALDRFLFILLDNGIDLL